MRKKQAIEFLILSFFILTITLPNVLNFLQITKNIINELNLKDSNKCFCEVCFVIILFKIKFDF